MGRTLFPPISYGFKKYDHKNRKFVVNILGNVEACKKKKSIFTLHNV